MSPVLLPSDCESVLTPLVTTLEEPTVKPAIEAPLLESPEPRAEEAATVDEAADPDEPEASAVPPTVTDPSLMEVKVMASTFEESMFMAFRSQATIVSILARTSVSLVVMRVNTNPTLMLFLHIQLLLVYPETQEVQ